jgi:hypothetical protein
MDVITALIRRTRRRLSLFHTACGLSEVALLWGGLLLVCALLTAVLPAGALRGLAILTALAGLAATAWRRGFDMLGLRSTDDRVARHIETRIPGLGSGLITAVQLARDAADPLRAVGMSAALAGAAIEDAAGRVRGADLASLIDREPLRRRAAAIVALTVAYGMVFLAAPGPLRDGLYRLAIPGAVGAGLERTEVLDEPVAGDFTIEYRYPAYTGLPNRVIQGSSGDIQALRGTVVTVRARSFEPVIKGALLIEGKEANVVSLAVTEGRDLSGSFTLQEDGTWRLSLVGGDGAKLEERTGYPIIVSADQRPRVEMVAPAEDLELDPTDSVSLAFRARDDFGIQGLSLVHQVMEGGGEPVRTPLAVDGEGRLEVIGEDVIELATLSALPGDRIAFFLEATDNDTVEGPKTGVSATRYIKIHSPRERHSEVLSTMKLLWEQMLDHLADRLEAEPSYRDRGRFPETRKAFDELGAGTAGLLTGMGKLLAAMAEDTLAREDLYAGLAAVRLTLAKLYRIETALLERAIRQHQGGVLATSVVQRLQRSNEAVITQLEKAILGLDELFRQQSLTDLEDLTKELLASQDRLRDLINQYKESPDLGTKRQIQREIGRLKSRMQELMRRIADLMKTLPMEHLNQGALKEGRAAKAKAFRDRLAAIEAALERGDTDAALAELEKLANELQEMASALEQDTSDFDSREDSSLKELGALQESLNQMVKEQQGLEEATRAVEQAANERRRELLESKLEDFLEAEREKVAELRLHQSELLDLLEGRDARSADEELADRVRRSARHSEILDEQLVRRDIAGAFEAAEAVAEQMAKARRELSWSGLPMFRQRGNMRGRREERVAGAAEGKADEIKEDLSRLLPGEEGRFDKSEEEALDRLAERQGSLEQQAQQVRERMQALEGKLPLQAEQMAEGLGKAAGHMDRAAKQLGGHQPGPAAEAEQEAVGALERVQESVQQATQPGRKGQEGAGRSGREQEGHGRQQSTKRVKIPGSEGYRPPAGFREEILKGMKHRAPSTYKEQIKRYYRELVK